MLAEPPTSYFGKVVTSGLTVTAAYCLTGMFYGFLCTLREQLESAYKLPDQKLTSRNSEHSSG